MYITQIYKYKKDNIVYVGGEIPSGAEILETMNILNAENGYDIVNTVSKNSLGTSIWLKDNDTIDNYIEVEKLGE